jgi:hypothetical protein
MFFNQRDFFSKSNLPRTPGGNVRSAGHSRVTRALATPLWLNCETLYSRQILVSPATVEDFVGIKSI